MSNYIDRMEQELQDLNDKRKKLIEFLTNTPKEIYLTAQQRYLLLIQEKAMTTYASILEVRIALAITDNI